MLFEVLTCFLWNTHGHSLGFSGAGRSDLLLLGSVKKKQKKIWECARVSSSNLLSRSRICRMLHTLLRCPLGQKTKRVLALRLLKKYVFAFFTAAILFRVRKPDSITPYRTRHNSSSNVQICSRPTYSLLVIVCRKRCWSSWICKG